ncbi:hypothetical protein AC74_0841 [Escherichia coli 2-460-02_S4_C1]|nr:hypothetical protein EC2860050_0817 [Escherichia coli 2860050]KDW44398.1 hypothetical protein AC97_2358 [Escherichia coli 2-177-06_S4_C2]KEJ53017.1 hypothetical protein AC74_0841 [Escherichia coli 2-460-02_S4_C1]
MKTPLQIHKQISTNNQQIISSVIFSWFKLNLQIIEHL